MPWGETLAETLAKDLRQSDYRWVRLTAVHTLSKRCHPTGNSRIERKIEPVARDVSRALFGFVVAKRYTFQRRLQRVESRNGVTTLQTVSASLEGMLA